MFPGRPWEPMSMTTKDWMSLTPEWVSLTELVATNDVTFRGVVDKLQRPADSHCGDPFPHVVDWHGNLYIQDGHHRVQAARALGNRSIIARVHRPDMA